MHERHVVMRDGREVLIRPLRPEDAALYPDFVADITAEDLRLRFFAPLRQLSPDLLDKLIHYDPAKAMAFVAIEKATGCALGVVRLHYDEGGRSGEFAILIRTTLKGHGLGWLLMKHLIAFAKTQGLQTVHGQVLDENTTMLDMCAELGFHSADDPHERGVKQVTLSLDDVMADTL